VSRSRREEVIEEVEWLMDYRVVPEEIAQRLGYASTPMLTRTLQRYGRPDLANELDRREFAYIECHKDYVKPSRKTRL
jgi:hypothetical protein